MIQNNSLECAMLYNGGLSVYISETLVEFTIELLLFKHNITFSPISYDR